MKSSAVRDERDYDWLVDLSLKAAGNDAHKAQAIMIQAIRNDPLLRAAVREDVLGRKSELLAELESVKRSSGRDCLNDEQTIEIARKHGFSSLDDVRAQEHLADGAPEESN